MNSIYSIDEIINTTIYMLNECKMIKGIYKDAYLSAIADMLYSITNIDKNENEKDEIDF